MVTSVSGTAIGLIWSTASQQGQYFLFGMLACVVVTVPLIRRDYALLGPWSLLAVVVYVSCGVRGLFISLGLDGRQSIDSLFLLGHGPGYFARPCALYVVALAFVMVGYLWRPQRTPGPMVRALTAFRFPAMVGAVIGTLAIIGFVAFVLYVDRTGGLSGALSTKRTTINGLSLDDSYRSHGELRFVNTMSAVALWLHVARHAITARRATVARRLLTIALLANAALLPVYASSRSELGYIVVVAFAIHCGASGRLPRGRAVVNSVILCVVVLAVMTGARASSHGGPVSSGGLRQSIVDSVGEVLVYNRNFGDMQTTAHIIHAVPVVLPLEHGRTITAWIAAPIPRAVWPDKPLLQSGPVIGAKVYGNERSGVPPGFVAEMYWNFALPGVLLGSLLLGLILAYVRETFIPFVQGNPMVAVFYAVGLMRVGAYVLTGGVGSGVFKLVSDVVCLVGASVLLRLTTSTRAGSAQRQREGLLR